MAAPLAARVPAGSPRTHLTNTRGVIKYSKRDFIGGKKREREEEGEEEKIGQERKSEREIMDTDKEKEVNRIKYKRKKSEARKGELFNERNK